MDNFKSTTLKNYSEPEVLKLLEIVEDKGLCIVCRKGICPIISYCRTTDFGKSFGVKDDPSYVHHKHIKVEMAQDRLVYNKSTLKKIITERRKQWEEYLGKNR